MAYDSAPSLGRRTHGSGDWYRLALRIAPELSALLRKEREWQEREPGREHACGRAAGLRALICDYTEGLVGKEREAVQPHDYSDRSPVFDNLPGRHGVVNAAGTNGMKL